ncbi:Serine-type D-Ala-D-Ala carboxypeptidase [Methylobacterium sp. 4-46]|uniref:D-alanyl-D-alanine carboxypeptidase family protein n=1 Tax=unclassified Methylobacterium TaxID=2615210 RepID=UPI000152CBF8|nr:MULTISPECIES: D-alanyl-D-alanine carboxypeptidase family protein [Methylobacterium]ACA20543.1 Serine-type D-Ala-D-Ala carboxypeptidase [Methylobacterium sp. 4-46]WFT79710.1 D-alanyl-D-alanine carboxypeptidase [Methylobacterium nodulans]
MTGRAGRAGRAVTGLVAGLLLAAASAGAARAQGFQSQAPHAILLDADSGSVLYEKNADEPFSPASMAKLMTVEVIFDEMRKGRLNQDSEFPISENAWKHGGAGGGGSSMFAQLNSKVKLPDLLRGIIVQSGNDAAIAAAEAIGGTEDNFAQIMNRHAREIGLTRSTFRNPTGYSAPDQKVTARDLAKLAIHLIETYPDEYKLFSEREFTWNKIRQQNRNPLLTMDLGADGLKTGYLEESGYGLTGSAVQNGQRLILVVSGLKKASDRAAESRKLLDWGFRAFEGRQVFAPGETVAEVDTYGGEKGKVALVAKKPVRVLLPRGSADRLTARVVYQGPLKAPIEAGREVARLKVTRGEQQVLDMPLYTAESVGPGSMTQRALDAALEVGTGWVRGAFAKLTNRS